MNNRFDYAGKYLRYYEEVRYSFLEHNLRFLDRVRSIIVPSDAEEFADVSFYQAVMNWDEYAKHARACILRIGQNIWLDTEFKYNYREAKWRHLAVGGYFFFDGRATPQQQANVIINAMQGKSFEMELIIDWERNYNGLNEGLPNVVKLMKLVEEAGIACKAVGVYTGYYYFIENTSPILHKEEFIYLKTKPLWIAWYAAASLVKIPPPWTTWTHWQYGTPAVDWGQSTTEIDMNKHNGTKVQFEERYLDGEPTLPPPTGVTMHYYKIVGAGVFNIRAGTSISSADLGDLWEGDAVEVSEIVNVTTADKWGKLARITRANGDDMPLPAPVCYISLNTTRTMEYFPATGVPTIFIGELAEGSTLMVKDTDGNILWQWPEV